jgi:hypothetical protein
LTSHFQKHLSLFHVRSRRSENLVIHSSKHFPLLIPTRSNRKHPFLLWLKNFFKIFFPTTPITRNLQPQTAPALLGLVSNHAPLYQAAERKKGFAHFSNPSKFPAPIRFHMTQKPETCPLACFTPPDPQPQKHRQNPRFAPIGNLHSAIFNLQFPFFKNHAPSTSQKSSSFPAPKPKIQMTQKPENTPLAPSLAHTGSQLPTASRLQPAA